MDESRFNPLKVLRWHERIIYSLDGKKVGPIRANVDLTNLCNHNCEWCEPLAYREESIVDRRHTLGTGAALDLISDLGQLGCKMIHFSGGGEPFLHPAFGEILLKAWNYGMRTFVVTNGTFISKWLADILTRADHIRVSLDAPSGDIHRQIHRGKPDDFGRIISGLTDLVRARKESRHSRQPEIGLAYVVESRNCEPEMLREVIARAEEIGVDFIQFRPDSRLGYETRRCETYDIWSKAVKVLQSVQTKVKMLFSEARDNDVQFQREFSHCYASQTVAVIGANGDVQACCDERGKVFGNIYLKPFREIWLSDEHREKAQAIDPRLCPRCLMCRYNKAVESYIIRNDALAEFV